MPSTTRNEKAVDIMRQFICYEMNRLYNLKSRSSSVQYFSSHLLAILILIVAHQHRLVLYHCNSPPCCERDGSQSHPYHTLVGIVPPTAGLMTARETCQR